MAISSIHDHLSFKALFLFSRRFNRSTLLACIFSASFAYLSFSAWASRFCFKAVTLAWKEGSHCCQPRAREWTRSFSLPAERLPSHLSIPSPWPSSPSLLFALPPVSATTCLCRLWGGMVVWRVSIACLFFFFLSVPCPVFSVPG